MKVLHFELQYRIGGIESFLMNLSKYVSGKDIYFDFIMNGDNQKIEDEIQKRGFRVIKFNNISIAVKYLKILKLIRKEKYDYVHFHKNSAANVMLPLLVKCFTSSKIIIHSHNTQPSTKSFIKVFLHKMNKGLIGIIADYYLACSEVAAEWMFSKKLIEKKKIIIIKNGIDVDEFAFNSEKRITYRSLLGIDGKIALGSVGALRKQKNQELLIKCISKLNDRFILILIGEGPLECELKQLAKKLDVEKKCLFLGARNDVGGLLQALDIFLMPSLWEGLPVSAIEAQCADLCVLLSNGISKTTKLTNKTYFLDINNIQNWVDMIVKCSNDLSRVDNSQIITDYGYSMAESCKVLEQLYMEQ